MSQAKPVGGGVLELASKREEAEELKAEAGIWKEEARALLNGSAGSPDRHLRRLAKEWMAHAAGLRAQAKRLLKGAQ